MKKLTLIFFFAFAFAFSNGIEAKGIVIYHNGPTFSTIEQLPDSIQIEGEHVNLGVAYKQFGLFWLPIWNYGKTEYALVSDDENTAYSLSAEQMAELKTEYNLTIADEPSIPFWQQVGLKPILILLVIAVIWTYIPKKGEENEEAASDKEE